MRCESLRRFFAGLALLIFGASADRGVSIIAPTTAGAAISITVNDASDNAPVPGNCIATGPCTLRAAIEEANASAGDTTITLPDAHNVPNNPSLSHIYTVLDSNGEIDFLDSGHTITLNGAGASAAVVQMQSGGTITHRVFLVGSGTTATISGISVEDGNVAAAGGGILDNGGSLNLSSSSVTNNTGQSGGGIDVVSGSATLTNDTIDSNSATSTGGGVFLTGGTTTISGGSISSNTSASAGGGIYIFDANPGDSATLDGVTVDSNTASAFAGGGAYVENDAGSPTTVTLTDDRLRQQHGQRVCGRRAVSTSRTTASGTPRR